MEFLGSQGHDRRVQYGKIDNWLEVVPQLISRIHQPNEIVSRSLFALLTDLGKAHPQALVYPLTVAITSESTSRKRQLNPLLKNASTFS